MEIMVEKTYKINGIECASCAAAAEKAVKGLDGVLSASVNFATEKLTASFDPTKVTPEILHKALKSAGFELMADCPGDGGILATPASCQNTAIPRTAPRRMDKTLRTLWLKFGVAAGFTAVLMYVAMGSMIGLPLPFFLNPAWENGRYALGYALAQLFLTLPVLAAGYRFYTVGFKAILKRRPNMDALIAVGTAAAFAYSVFSLVQIARGVYADIHAAHDAELYFETAAGIIALVLLGRALEAGGKRKTNDAIQKLAELAPKTATVLRGGKETEIPIEAIQASDIVSARPGEKIAADGLVTEGAAAVDEAMLSGESLPVDKAPGERVYAGSINRNGFLQFRAENVGADTKLAQIIRLVEDAAGKKAPIARVADTVSAFFVPAVFAVALVAGAAWLFSGAGIGFALRIFVSVLVISCPCALGLATPAAIVVGTGIGAKYGILFKGGEAVEAARRIDTVVFDKTGTVTQGKPELTDIAACAGIEKSELLRLAASAEKGSEHPLGAAIVCAAEQEGLELMKPGAFETFPGFGVAAQIGKKRVLVGNRLFMERHGVAISELEHYADALSADGKTPMYAAADGVLLGILAAADVIKPGAADAVAALKRAGYGVIMMTGDNSRTAAAIAQQAGVQTVFAGMTPESKAAEVGRLRAQGTKAAFVGDGINDAPALTAADTGIAIGTGTDVAIESADVVLMKSELCGVLTALTLSKKTMRNIKQNLFWAFGYNVLGIPIAAGLLFLFGGPLLSPMVCAAAMVLSDFSLLLNVLRLKLFKPPD